MKKAVVAILACIYLVVSTGATIHSHYCMGKLVEWGLSPKSNGECSKCGMVKTNADTGKGCCNDKQQHVKLSADQKITASIEVMHLSCVALPVQYPNLIAVHAFSSAQRAYSFSNAPPRSSKVSLHIINSTFLI